MNLDRSAGNAHELKLWAFIEELGRVLLEKLTEMVRVVDHAVARFAAIWL